jgi:small conductance mechanosensitive channel
MGTKGETICRLGMNLLTYGGMIFFVYMALYNLGVNIGALIASLSLPAFALSLGAKDLITDIVAGISIVFDGEFKVGDIVEISGFSGRVLEIGVRTTKLVGSGNNIKIIANRDIKNVINMSRKTSFYTLQVKISMIYYSVEAVEEMLKEELPKLQGKIPEIIDGPSYKGVSSMGGVFATLSISAECNQADYSRVKNELNKAIKELFEEKGISVRF